MIGVFTLPVHQVALYVAVVLDVIEQLIAVKNQRSYVLCVSHDDQVVYSVVLPNLLLLSCAPRLLGLTLLFKASRIISRLLEAKL